MIGLHITILYSNCIEYIRVYTKCVMVPKAGIRKRNGKEGKKQYNERENSGYTGIYKESMVPEKNDVVMSFEREAIFAFGVIETRWKLRRKRCCSWIEGRSSGLNAQEPLDLLAPRMFGPVTRVNGGCSWMENLKKITS